VEGEAVSAESDVTLIELTLSRVIDENGRIGVRVKTPENFNAVEALGVIEAAKFWLFSEMSRGRL
jgi:hypothetical protein